MNSHAIHPVNQEIAVRFDSVSFSYGAATVLEKVSFHLHRGEFVALMGPNGSGKTTVLKLLLGLEQPVSGRVTLFGQTGEGAAWRDRLGYVPQQGPADRTFPITVRDAVRMGLLQPFRGYKPGSAAAAVSEAMEQTGIAELAGRTYAALSGGERRRVLVARALAARPEILILDEPTANMDAESEARLFETLGRLKGKTTVLIVTHDSGFVSALTDRVLCLGDNERHPGGIVQHRIEAVEGGDSYLPSNGRHGVDNHHGSLEARVLHGENIPADDCYGQ